MAPRRNALKNHQCLQESVYKRLKMYIYSNGNGNKYSNDGLYTLFLFVDIYIEMVMVLYII